MQQVTSNVLTETRKRGSNPSIVTTKAGVVVIDTPQLPTDAVAMRELAEGLGQIEYIFNTEHHSDHIFGNYYFRGAGTVIHHQKIYENFMVPEPVLDPFEFVAESVRSQDPEGLSIFPERNDYYEDVNKATVWSCGSRRRRSERGTLHRRPEDHVPGAAHGRLRPARRQPRVVLQVARPRQPAIGSKWAAHAEGPSPATSSTGP